MLRLAKYRRETKFSARDIAARVGDVTHPTVLKWMKGKLWPRLDEASRLADVLGCTLDDLAGHEPKGKTLTDGQEAVIEAYRESGLTVNQAIKRLKGEVIVLDPDAFELRSGKEISERSDTRGGRRENSA